MNAWYEARHFLQHLTGIGMDALHVLAEVAALFIFAVLLRRPVSSK